MRKDHRDKNTARLTSLRRPVTLYDIRKGQRCLRGKWVHATVGRGHGRSASGALNGGG